MADFGMVSGGARFGAIYGASPTAAATANTKGAYSEIIASLPFDADLLRISIEGNDGVGRRFAYDIAIGAAGSEQIILNDLYFGVLDGSRAPFTLDIPIAVKAGTRVSVRAQCTTASEACAIFIMPIASPMMRMSNLNGAMSTIGFNAASTIGVNLTPANTWVELIASTAERYRAAYLALSSNSNITNHAAATVSLGVGPASAEQAILTSSHIHRLYVYDWYPPYVPLSQVDIPAGSRIAARTSDVVAPVHVIFYGVR